MPESATQEPGCKGLYMYPDPGQVRQPLAIEGGLGNVALERVYRSAIDSYNHGLWNPVAVMCRQTLEGIVQVLDPNGKKGPLFQQLDAMLQKPELLEPLKKLAQTLRTGGNLGAHFDSTMSTDEEFATQMLDLLDFFLEYTFVLRKRADSLAEYFNKSKGTP